MSFHTHVCRWCTSVCLTCVHAHDFAGVATILVCIVATLKEYLRLKELARAERRSEEDRETAKKNKIKAG